MSVINKPLDTSFKLREDINKALAKKLLAFSCISGTALAALVAGSYAGLKNERGDRWERLHDRLFPETSAGDMQDGKKPFSSRIVNKRLRNTIVRYFSFAGGALGLAGFLGLVQSLLSRSTSTQRNAKYLAAARTALRTLTLIVSSTGLASLLRYLLQKPLALLLGKTASKSISVGVQQGDKKASYELCTPESALSAIVAGGVGVLAQRTRKWWLRNILSFGSCFHAIAESSDSSFAIVMLKMVAFSLDNAFVEASTARFFGKKVKMTIGQKLDDTVIKYPMDSLCKPTVFASLGLGDIVIPGALVSLALRYDRAISGRVALNSDYEIPAYFTASLGGYTAGLLGALTAYPRSGKAQPALAYVIPSTVLPVLALAWYKGDLQRMFQYDASKEIPGQEDEEENAESI